MLYHLEAKVSLLVESYLLDSYLLLCFLYEGDYYSGLQAESSFRRCSFCSAECTIGMYWRLTFAKVLWK